MACEVHTFAMLFLIMIKYQAMYYPNIFEMYEDEMVINFINRTSWKISIILCFFEFAVFTDIKTLTLYNLPYGNDEAQEYGGITAPFLIMSILLFWIYVYAKIELDNFKHNTVDNLSLKTYLFQTLILHPSFERRVNQICSTVILISLCITLANLGYFEYCFVLTVTSADCIIIVYILKNDKIVQSIKSLMCHWMSEQIIVVNV